MGGMGIIMLLGLLVIAIVIGAAIYLALRAGGAGPGEVQSPDAVELLRRRLAAGEITTDEYLERESALGDREPARGRR